MLSVRNFGLRKIQFAVLALLLAIPLAVVAQVTTATIVGTITDPGGAIMPGAQVTARNRRHRSDPHRNLRRGRQLPA